MEATLLDSAILGEASDAAGFITNSLHASTTYSIIGPGSARTDQARSNQTAQARAMFVESQNRVHSISLVHEKRYRAGDLARIVVEVAGVQLGVDTAIPCGLIVTELVTNALKHPFPNAASGLIRICAVTEPEGWLKLTVQDNGVGLSENLDIRRYGSLGLELVGSLVRQLVAKLEIGREGGTTFRIHFRLPGN